ncbi:MAG TPA: hypothetical protein VM120_25615 [Bryobacteraceae bacterium]|nr:hypothetical protein [Bryobacteraceae bacterium]
MPEDPEIPRGHPPAGSKYGEDWLFAEEPGKNLPGVYYSGLLEKGWGKGHWYFTANGKAKYETAAVSKDKVFEGKKDPPAKPHEPEEPAKPKSPAQVKTPKEPDNGRLDPVDKTFLKCGSDGGAGSKETSCLHKELWVKCKHRGFYFPFLKYPALQVLGTCGKDTIDGYSVIVKGPCGAHVQNNIFQLARNQHALNQTGSNLTIQAENHRITRDSIFAERHYWPAMGPVVTYDLIAKTCGASTSRQIVAFPDIEFDLSLSVTPWKHKPGEDAIRSGRKVIKKETDGTFEKQTVAKAVDFKFDAKLDGVNHDLAHQFNFVCNLFERVTGAVKIANGIAETLSKLNPGVITLNVANPAAKLKGKWSWMEEKNTPLCRFAVEASLSGHPLIGFSFRIDVMKFLLSLSGAFGKTVEFIELVLNKLPGVKVTLAARITVDGLMQGDCEVAYYKNLGGSWYRNRSEGGISAVFPVTLKLELSVTLGDPTAVGVSAGAKGDAKSSIEASLTLDADNHGLFLRETAHFAGLTWIYDIWFTVTVKYTPPPDSWYSWFKIDTHHDKHFTNTQKPTVIFPPSKDNIDHKIYLLESQ